MPRDSSFTVVIGDDHPLMVEALRDRLGSSERLRVCGTATSADDLLRVARSTKPDLVVVDNRMPGRSGIECAAEIVAASPSTRVVLLSAFTDSASVTAALEAGASGYLDKSRTAPELIRALIEIAERTEVEDNHARRRQLESAERREATSIPEARLSAREVDVLRLVAEGLSNRQVAERLGVTQQTIKTHLERLFAKLGVSDRTAAVGIAMRRGLID